MNFPNDRVYHADHLWAQEQADGSWLIGVTDYAQDQLGSVIFVDMPEQGAQFEQGQSCASIESVKVTSEAIMPAINDALAATPELLNTAPYGEGWLLRVTALPYDAAACMNSEAYAAMIGA
ncbi:glycine cleavage system protein H [Desulfovibrio sp.]|uniref:glycine cleavage system protein H n=1 Tax=Desulfovibrio sp. TaxID=885 RepID=UPI0025BC2279|nr:glycine cleavage system protein H [Desulfovibrio sp.]